MRFCKIRPADNTRAGENGANNLPACPWVVARQFSVPSGDEVHLWRGWLDESDAVIDELVTVLSTEELDRAHRFRFERDRRRFMAGRGMLRAILSGCLGDDPERLRFHYEPHGKPCLAARHQSPPVRFNVAHSDKLFLCAVGRNHDVGVDVERIRPIPDADELAERFFSVDEQARLRTLTGRRHDEAFFRCWTRKEAWLKAVGEGIVGLDAAPKAPESPQARDDRQAGGFAWITSFTPEPGYAGALALCAEQRGEACRC